MHNNLKTPNTFNFIIPMNMSICLTQHKYNMCMNINTACDIMPFDDVHPI